MRSSLRLKTCQRRRRRRAAKPILIFFLFLLSSNTLSFSPSIDPTTLNVNAQINDYVNDGFDAFDK
jgi:hypothetical protein